MYTFWFSLSSISSIWGLQLIQHFEFCWLIIFIAFHIHKWDLTRKILMLSFMSLLLRNKKVLVKKKVLCEKGLSTTDDTWTKPSVLSLYTQCSGAEMGVRMRVVVKSKYIVRFCLKSHYECMYLCNYEFLIWSLFLLRIFTYCLIKSWFTCY